MNKLSTMLFQVVTVEQCCNNMLTTILFIVGRTTLFTPVDINLEQVVDFLNFYACRSTKTLMYNNRPCQSEELADLFNDKFVAVGSTLPPLDWTPLPVDVYPSGSNSSYPLKKYFN